jgi:hypothetical protein
MEAVKGILLLLQGRPTTLPTTVNRADSVDERDLAAAASLGDVTLQDVVDAERILRLTEAVVSAGSRREETVVLRFLAGLDRSHGALPVPAQLAADFLAGPDSLTADVEARLEAADLAGQVLLAAVSKDKDRVDEAAEHPCAVVRVAAAANHVPTQRLYALASDPCRDVALVALENERGQQLMTRQFRAALQVADGYPLRACPCGAQNA